MAEQNFNIEKLKVFAEDVVDRAGRNVGATRRINGKTRRYVSTGNLRNSLTYNIRDNKKGKMYVKFFAKGTAAQYADIIESGRTPGAKMPPVDAIKKWIMVKPLRLRDLKTGAFTKMTPAKIDSAAFLIARSISKKGIKGIRYFEEALQDVIDDTGDDFFDSFISNVIL
jgi:hypothetical protein